MGLNFAAGTSSLMVKQIVFSRYLDCYSVIVKKSIPTIIFNTSFYNKSLRKQFAVKGAEAQYLPQNHLVKMRKLFLWSGKWADGGTGECRSLASGVSRFLHCDSWQERRKPHLCLGACLHLKDIWDKRRVWICNIFQSSSICEHV